MLKKTVSSVTNSIKWRILAIFIIIVFIAMTVAGVFVTNKLESYEIDSIRTKCFSTLDIVMLSIPFDSYTSLQQNQETIQAIVNEWQTGTDYELYVVDSNFRIVAANNTSVVDRSAINTLNENVIINALEGEDAGGQDTLPGSIPVLNAAKPITGSDGSTIGVLYLSANLTSVYDTTNESKVIFLQAMFIALLITAILSFFITNSITAPIYDLTEKAEKMAFGDFSQEIRGKSNDEIGRLADMFNILRRELDYNINEISNEKSKLETILKYMADGLIAVDLSGEIIHVNEAARTLLDLSDEEIGDLDFPAILRRLGKKDITDGIRHITSSETMNEVINYHSRILSVRYARFVADDDNDIGVIMLIQDITEGQKLEKMQTDFVANVSHELRTPLTTIRSYTETLLDGGVEDEETRNNFLTVIDDETERMARLVKELLQLSRLDNETEKMNMEELEVGNLLDDCVRKILLTAESKQQSVECPFRRQRPLYIFADRDKIQQVLLNILMNAIKYTQEGGKIRIDSFIRGDTVNISIADNGIGISEAEVSRIFERFYRVDKARSRSMGGTGLGLSIAKQITEVHDGKISVRSREGEGTTMTVTLPLMHGSDRKNTAGQQPEQQENPVIPVKEE